MVLRLGILELGDLWGPEPQECVDKVLSGLCLVGLGLLFYLFGGSRLALRVQVPNDHILPQDLYYNYY